MKSTIIEKATKLFLQLGFKSVTMDDLAVSLGISKKTLYIHFENKHQLVKEVAHSIFEKVTRDIIKIKDGTSNPIEELHCVKMEAMKYLGSEKTSPNYQLQKYFPKIYEDLKTKEYQYLGELVKNSLQNGIDTDLFRAEIDVEFVSRLYLNGMRGIRDIEIFPIEQFKIEELFENYLDYHLRAIVTPKGLKSLTLFKSTT
ncbi:MAG: TetR/AcrR family transcriptional regulator [Flavobacteriaceae bacterium]|jgi:AcrR family transcriptional regulator|nr:TetR/AcrR family transcriptional regulator [Flavobacteriaceae bacterium]|tara:strand:- start:184 stop:783 length:600 start_codon:yes stop_codon:yes gene_type:complete